MNYFLAKFKHWIESDWVFPTTMVMSSSICFSAQNTTHRWLPFPKICLAVVYIVICKTHCLTCGPHHSLQKKQSQLWSTSLFVKHTVSAVVHITLCKKTVSDLVHIILCKNTVSALVQAKKICLSSGTHCSLLKKTFSALVHIILCNKNCLGQLWSTSFLAKNVSALVHTILC